MIPKAIAIVPLSMATIVSRVSVQFPSWLLLAYVVVLRQDGIATDGAAKRLNARRITMVLSEGILKKPLSGEVN